MQSHLVRPLLLLRFPHLGSLMTLLQCAILSSLVPWAFFVCLLTTLFATDFFEVRAVREIEPALKKQLFISTSLMIIGVAIISWIALPSSCIIFNFGAQVEVKNWQLCLCVCVGLWDGLCIGFVTEYFTSNSFSFSFAAMYGIAVAAIGMLSTIATRLAIDAYGPISDNAGSIAEMARMSIRIRERTTALNAAGNTTAAIGKGFTIGSAALVSLALLGAFVSRAGILVVDVLTPKVIIGLLVGAMFPYWFLAMALRSVGSAALKMVEEVRRQFKAIPGLMEGVAMPDYETCVKISTDASIKEMIFPGALVMLTPLIVGIFFGVETLSVPAIIIVFVFSRIGTDYGDKGIAISASNTGGAWENAKKYIEAGESYHAFRLGPKGSDPHKAALMAVESLVFAPPFFVTHGGLLFKIF
ncbi:H(+)-exporting diphosphatase [Heracleum sosnowskyi]|uniref:H(+)-exporting diphosphatase n=1 Tax=Heracleum sosnowskyi TaxID=360622 RepID=A0AAD8MYH2_9APIA|nr:H(+)-exporting diphosphatase [Heracleum sosnowskyi]